MSNYLAGAIVKITEDKPGVYKVSQEREKVGLPIPVPGGPQDRSEIDYTFGPLHIIGYYDASTLEIGITITVIGIKIGNFYGNLKDGVGIDVDLFVVSGHIKFYLKNGNEVWVNFSLDVKFDGSFNQDVKII